MFVYRLVKKTFSLCSPVSLSIHLHKKNSEQPTHNIQNFLLKLFIFLMTCFPYVNIFIYLYLYTGKYKSPLLLNPNKYDNNQLIITNNNKQKEWKNWKRAFDILFVTHQKCYLPLVIYIFPPELFIQIIKIHRVIVVCNLADTKKEINKISQTSFQSAIQKIFRKLNLTLMGKEEKNGVATRGSCRYWDHQFADQFKTNSLHTVV